MSMRRIACVELTSVPDMIFEAQRYKWGIHNTYHYGDTNRTRMPNNAFCKITHSAKDNVELLHFV